MKINKYISMFFIILFSILLIDCAISEENKNQHMEPDRIILVIPPGEHKKLYLKKISI